MKIKFRTRQLTWPQFLYSIGCLAVIAYGIGTNRILTIWAGAIVYALLPVYLIAGDIRDIINQRK